MITKFACDFALPEKLVYAAGTLFAGVARQAKGIRMIEGVVGIMDESLAAEHMVEAACKAEHAMQAGMQESALAQFMSAENDVSKFNPRSNVSLSHLVKEARSVIKNGMIPFEHEELIADLKAALQRLQDRLKCNGYDQMKQNYYKRVIIKDGKKYNITMTGLDHTALFDFDFAKKRKLGGVQFKLTGGHAPGTWNALEREGLVISDNVRKLDKGCVKYFGRNVLTNEPMTKTEFPLSWTQEKIFKSVWKVYDNGIEKLNINKNPIKILAIDEIELSISLKCHTKAMNITNIVPYCLE